MLSDSDRDVRLETVRTIVTIGTQHSLDPLITATGDNDPEVQIRATDGLVNFYLPGYVVTGVARFGSAIRGRFDGENRDIIDAWITVRPDVVTAIGKLTAAGRAWSRVRTQREQPVSYALRRPFLISAIPADKRHRRVCSKR